MQAFVVHNLLVSVIISFLSGLTSKTTISMTRADIISVAIIMTFFMRLFATFASTNVVGLRIENVIKS